MLTASNHYTGNYLTYHFNSNSLTATINKINHDLCNTSHNLSLRINDSIDYIDLSLIKDNVESMEIIYNSNCNMNKMAMIYCENKQNLKEITFNFNTQEKIYCLIINCPSNITINGGNNVFTDIKTDIKSYIDAHSHISIRGYNTNSICVSTSIMTKLELENIEDLTLNNVHYIKDHNRIGPISKRIQHINKLTIDDIDKL